MRENEKAEEREMDWENGQRDGFKFSKYNGMSCWSSLDSTSNLRRENVLFSYKGSINLSLLQAFWL